MKSVKDLMTSTVREVVDFIKSEISSNGGGGCWKIYDFPDLEKYRNGRILKKGRPGNEWKVNQVCLLTHYNPEIKWSLDISTTVLFVPSIIVSIRENRYGSLVEDSLFILRNGTYSYNSYNIKDSLDISLMNLLV